MTSVKKVFTALMAVLATSATAAQENDNLHFVYELTRHGARAPTATADNYSVGAGELTAQGMRQRYLLGRYNRQRYTEDYQFLDLEQGSKQVKMFSTLVDRTMQSGYSELMGLFNPDPLQTQY